MAPLPINQGLELQELKKQLATQALELQELKQQLATHAAETQRFWYDIGLYSEFPYTRSAARLLASLLHFKVIHRRGPATRLLIRELEADSQRAMHQLGNMVM